MTGPSRRRLRRAIEGADAALQTLASELVSYQEHADVQSVLRLKDDLEARMAAVRARLDRGGVVRDVPAPTTGPRPRMRWELES